MLGWWVAVFSLLPLLWNLTWGSASRVWKYIGNVSLPVMSQEGADPKADDISPPTTSATSASPSSVPFRPRPHAMTSSSQRSSSVSSTVANVGAGVSIGGGGGDHHQHPALSPNVTTTCGLAYVRSPVLLGSSSGHRSDHHHHHHHHRKRPLPRLPPQNIAMQRNSGMEDHQHQMQHMSFPSHGVAQFSPMGMESPAKAGIAMDDGMPPPPSLFASTGPRRTRGGGGSGGGVGRTQGPGTRSGDLHLRSSAASASGSEHHAQDIMPSSSYDGSVASSSACSSTIPPLVGERSNIVATNGASSIWKSNREEHDATISASGTGVNADAAAHRRIAGASSFDSLASTTSDLLRTTGQVAAGAWTKGSPHIARLGSAATTMLSRTLSREEDYNDLPYPSQSPRRGIAEVGSRWGHAAGAIISRTLSREEDFDDLKAQRIPTTSPRRALGEVGGRLGNAAASMISRTLSREDDYDYDVRLPRRERAAKCDVTGDQQFSSAVLHRWEDCVFVRAEGGRPGSVMITATHLIFEFDETKDEPEYLRRSRHRFVTEGDYMSGFTEDQESGRAFALQIDGPKERRESIDSSDSFTGTLPQPPTPSSSTGGTSNTKCSTLDGSNESDDNNSYCSDTYQEDMGKTLIRAVEEEARRRLKELDDGGEGDAASTVGSVASSTTASLFFARRQTPWQAASGSIGLHRDEDSESGISDIDEDRLKAWRRQAEAQAEALAIASSEENGPVGKAETGARSSTKADSDQGQARDGLDTYALDPEIALQESRFRGFKWRLSSLGEIYSRVFMMRDVAFEIFAKTMDSGRLSDTGHVPLGDLSNQSFYIAIPPMRHASFNQRSRRDEVVDHLKKSDQACGLSFAYWHSNNATGGGRWTKILRGQTASNSGIDGKALNSLYTLTRAWRKGEVSNFCYLSRLNASAGRTRHDPSSYPVFPWVLCNYTSDVVPDLSNRDNYRDLSKPMGALSDERLDKFMGKYQSLCNSIDSPIPAFMYGSHYSSTGGVPLHFLVRKRPFAGLHRQLQGGSFDLPDRIFRSIAMTYDLCSRTSSTDVKELTPEFYSDPTFLMNSNGFDLGVCASGEVVNDVILPPWADGSPQKFVGLMRDALESDICSKMLPSWIDLIFGISSRGSEARKAHNIFYHLTYIEPRDLEKIVDEELRREMELHIADFGRCPQQLFHTLHPSKRRDVGKT